MSKDNLNQCPPLPQKRAHLPLNIPISKKDFERIQAGFVPKDTDDRWYVHYKDGEIHFHRSWTGFCIFQLHVQPDKQSYCITDGWVNRDPDQYRSNNLDDDRDLLFGLFKVLFGIELKP
ncbi:hypothetical protein [Thermoflavimicrobium dichotomicum]|uniref:Uncharacterized protein n=1 Tax=Thermoflavimicrobium dichotomicum TaxID=46223 RepID=A0A1I3S6P6_9BACL|nr:hypothetical protein [Thermoflavimicrobium dichotomicum]SFJ54365.1 hypothetical protein SAMN05421852_11242 [Thermoflavimicrobium dichotomicum]